MFIIYDLVFLIIAIIYLPIYLFRRKFHRGFLARLGFLSRDLNLDRPIWVHAVSLGEAISIRGLIGELRKKYPDKKFFISTVTVTGNKIVRGIAQDSDFVTYLPLDFSFVVKRVINKIRPSLFIVAETEIWPNLISFLSTRNIPIIVVNGRISDSSFRGYLMIQFLLKPILNKITLFCVQSERDCQRLMRLGVSGDRIKITGNMKFDGSTPLTINPERSRRIDFPDLKQKLGLGLKEKLLVAGSTHLPEEEIILEVYRELNKEFSNLRLLIAPRHPERTEDIERLIIRYNFQPLKISQINLQPTSYKLQPVFILDTIGQLMHYYALADIVFMGGSLVKKGGHNILEPAALGKPVLFGPHMFNFRDIAELFLKEEAAILVHSPQELREKIRDLLNNPSQGAQLSWRAKELILKNQGATEKNSQFIKNIYARISS